MITLGKAYQRPDRAWAVLVIREDESACCNSGHDTPSEAARHGEAQVRSWSSSAPRSKCQVAHLPQEVEG